MSVRLTARGAANCLTFAVAVAAVAAVAAVVAAVAVAFVVAAVYTRARCAATIRRRSRTRRRIASTDVAPPASLRV